MKVICILYKCRIDSIKNLNSISVKLLIVFLCLQVFTSRTVTAQAFINPSNPIYDSAKRASIYSTNGGVWFLTDSIDYQPGSTVTFTGGGFFPNESVRITVSLLGYPLGVGNAYFPFDVQCDVNGEFDAYWYCDSQNLGRQLQATVLGLTSSYSSIVLFTDGTPLSSCYFAPDATYTDIPANDDATVGPINLGFTFNFYGTNYTQCFINNNGTITFGLPMGGFSSSGFPFSIPMIAPFWADVDTRGIGSGIAKYKLSQGKLVVSWDRVGYYPSIVDKLNTFQVILTDGSDPSIGIGNNVGFNYGDMQWTSGNASGGSSGFGGTPATVGINKGDGTNFLQVGRFSLNSALYDGGAGNEDGVNYLDYECFRFNVSNFVNAAPSVSGVPSGNSVTIPCGTTQNIVLTFLPPETNQSVTATINTNGLCNTTTSRTSGSTAVASVNITGAACNMGTNTITFTATDNFVTPATTTLSITVNVVPATTTASANTPICAGQTINLTTTSIVGATAYSWVGPNGFTSNIQNPIITNATSLMSGTYTVNVTIAGGCSATSSVIVTVNPLPSVSANIGSPNVCLGNTTILSNAASGGTWSSSNTSIATITSTGIVRGLSIGTSNIKYLIVNANGCRDSAMTTVTVGTLPIINALTGTQNICVGSRTTFSSTTIGGTFTSSNNTIATVNQTTGEVTGISAGTATIIYTFINATGCSSFITRIVTVNAIPSISSITGDNLILIKANTQLSCMTTGGVWSSGNPSVVTINSSGFVTAITSGSSLISYTISNANGCSAIATNLITVNPVANP